MPPKCHPHDSGALAFLTMHKHKLPVKEIKTAKELDLSNKGLIVIDAIDAIVIAALIKVQTTLLTKRDKTKRNSFQDNGALASLDISNNKLTQGKQTGGFEWYETPEYATDMSGVIALAEGLKK